MQTVDDALREMRLKCDGADYRLLRLPPNAITLAAGIVAEAGLPFAAMLVDAREVSLLLRDDACVAFAGRLKRATTDETRYRLITLDVTLTPQLVGFMARVCDCLAAKNVPVLAFAAYSRDHLAVPAQQLERAMEALESLKRTVEN